MLHVVQAVQAWHDAGYLHGDIKPANVAVDEHDRVRLLDMDHSVRVVPADTGGAQPKVTGTYGFNATDVVASASSEVYSVGVTLQHEVKGCHFLLCTHGAMYRQALARDHLAD